MVGLSLEVIEKPLVRARKSVKHLFFFYQALQTHNISEMEFGHLTDDGSDDKPHHNQVYFYVAYNYATIFFR